MVQYQPTAAVVVIISYCEPQQWLSSCWTEQKCACLAIFSARFKKKNNTMKHHHRQQPKTLSISSLESKKAQISTLWVLDRRCGFLAAHLLPSVTCLWMDGAQRVLSCDFQFQWPTIIIYGGKNITQCYSDGMVKRRREQYVHFFCIISISITLPCLFYYSYIQSWC